MTWWHDPELWANPGKAHSEVEKLALDAIFMDAWVLAILYGKPVRKRAAPETCEIVYHLPRRRKQVLDYIRDYIGRNHRSPTLSEIAESVRMSRSAVQRQLDALETQGYIVRTPGKRRSIELA